MPITKRQFELRINEEIGKWMVAVYSYLADHKDLAYSSAEIRDVMANTLGRPRILDDDRGGVAVRTDILGIALDRLVGTGAVQERVVAGGNYYSFYHEFDTDTWNPRLLST